MQSIAILIERLNKGGAERSASQLSKILKNLGYDVTIITLFDDVAYPYSGQLINLEVYNASKRKSNISRKLSRYFNLKEVIVKNDFDLILDFRVKEKFLRELLLNHFILKDKMVNMVRSYRVDWYLPKSIYWAKYIYRNHLSINTVSVKIQKRIEAKYGFENLQTIYSPLDIEEIKGKSAANSVFNEKFVLAVGRLDANKQFDKLIDSYYNSVLHKNGISLYIMGNSPDLYSTKPVILDKARKYNIQDKIKLLPFQENPFIYMKHAMFLVLSSKNEGLPRVLIESLACGTPIIAFNCNSGPSEVVFHKENGLLVKDQDFGMLTKAMNEFYENKLLYAFCKQNAYKGLERFSFVKVEKEWDIYIKKLLTSF